MNFLEERDGFLNSERYDCTVFIHLWMWLSLPLQWKIFGEKQFN